MKHPDFDRYRSLAKPAEGIYKEKGSKFLAFAYPTENEEQVKSRLAELKRQFHDARHHCYAYIVDPAKPYTRANDDGEPSNTAGIPILNQIRSFDLCNVLVVVVRYFGGTKLGASGLIQAYKSAAQAALEVAEIHICFLTETIKLRFSYEATNEVQRILQTFNLKPTDQQFGADCQMQVAVRLRDLESCRAQLNGIEGLKLL